MGVGPPPHVERKDRGNAEHHKKTSKAGRVEEMLRKLTFNDTISTELSTYIERYTNYLFIYN